jgi:hypothetical protein
VSDKDPLKDEKRTRMGRPQLPRTRVRSNRVVTFVTDREMTALTRRAEKAGMSLSAFVHAILANQQPSETELVSEE